MEGGYCQSMNFIASLLLSHMENELAFYTQVCINRIMFPNYFTDELVVPFFSLNASLECAWTRRSSPSC